MAAREISESSDSSEQNSSDESDFCDVNLYDSEGSNCVPAAAG